MQTTRRLMKKSRSESETSPLVEKGSDQKTIEVTQEEIKGYLICLKNNFNTNLNELSPSDADKFNKLKRCINLLIGTSMWPSIVCSIDEIYKDYYKCAIKVGTYGAYISGCRNADNSSFETEYKGCSPIAAGNLFYADGISTSCPNDVIISYYNKGTYNFLLVNEKNERNKVSYLFVPNNPCFEGFTQCEKNELRKLKVEEILLYTYNVKDGRKIEQLYPEPVCLDKISTRTKKECKEECEKKEYISPTMLTIIIIFVLIIIVGLVYYLNKPKKEASKTLVAY